MLNECEIQNVKCVSTSDSFSILRGDSCFLPVPKARMLEALGTVKIIDKIETKTRVIEDDDYLFRYKFSKRKMTRVAWVQNYSYNGGAEISNFSAIRVGQNLGFDIVGLNIDEFKSCEIMSKADVIIVNNLHSPNRGEVLDYLARTTVPWIKYDHDCGEVEKFLYTDSKKNVFISPRHKKHYIDYCGKEIEPKSVCLPLAFNVDMWQNSVNGRIKDSVFVPNYEKSRTNLLPYIKEHPEKQYFIAGNIQPIGNTISLGEIPYQSMPELYRKYETVFHSPSRLCAGERVLFEAVLCGCKVITDDLAGHTSWDFDWRDERVLRPILKRSVYQFWREVERVAYAS